MPKGWFSGIVSNMTWVGFATDHETGEEVADLYEDRETGRIIVKSMETGEEVNLELLEDED